MRRFWPALLGAALVLRWPAAMRWRHSGASASASGAPEPGMVEPKPANATQVDVVLRE